MTPTEQSMAREIEWLRAEVQRLRRGGSAFAVPGLPWRPNLGDGMSFVSGGNGSTVGGGANNTCSGSKAA